MNTLLLFGKAIATFLSSSPAVLASLIDSSVDVMVQAALFWASRAAKRGANTALYPVGRGQLEPVAVVVCAALKCAGMVAVFSRSVDLLLDQDQDLTKHGCLHPHDVHHHGLRHLWHSHWDSVVLLFLVSASKFGFCYWCETVVRGSGHHSLSETARAVVADNQNDVVLSTGALASTIVTQLSQPLWFVDPTAACALALYIFVYWVRCGRQQIEMIVGRAAEPSFLELVREIAETHDPSVSLDTVRAYHFGPRFLVELEVVMDETTVLRETHDSGILLQHKVEALPSVERCFVHIDYQHRIYDDHDHTTPVVHKMHKSVVSPVDPGSADSLAALLRHEHGTSDRSPRSSHSHDGSSRGV